LPKLITRFSRNLIAAQSDQEAAVRVQGKSGRCGFTLVFTEAELPNLLVLGRFDLAYAASISFIAAIDEGFIHFVYLA
jgi:hypothetical protein